ncbi:MULTISPECIES: hypothetical protein [unclassified Streptomyces]|uniref:hypothetical protein n=1 Tax=unclassified Streptomyces TaxID=2593676 RepID=UPI0023672F0F|nr:MULTISPECIES: hypothetical protein [unclassified Streptomyces]MDF3141074.1 hypothetical protein [Streptomyces sp. T21Q-yed]WDF45059.1 hypothetical protein PBV52_51075 [Streptomyces sp. T12]
MALSVLTRRLDTPRNVYGEVDYSPPAAGVAGCAGLAGFVAAASFAISSRLWHDDRTIASVVIVAGILVPGYAVFFLARRFMTRHGLYAWQLVAASAVACAVIWAAPKLSDAMYPHPWDRYDTQFASCLAGTPYAPREAGVELDSDQNALTLFSLVKEVPELHVGPAYQFATKPMKGLDSQSRQILDQHGC